MKKSRSANSSFKEAFARPSQDAGGSPFSSSDTPTQALMKVRKDAPLSMPQQPASVAGPPRGNRKGVAVFALAAKDAKNVQVAGSFTEWEGDPINMQPAADGVWRVTVALEPGRYAYRFLVDGEWQDDPMCERREENPFGTSNSVLEVL